MELEALKLVIEFFCRLFLVICLLVKQFKLCHCIKRDKFAVWTIGLTCTCSKEWAAITVPTPLDVYYLDEIEKSIKLRFEPFLFKQQNITIFWHCEDIVDGAACMCKAHHHNAAILAALLCGRGVQQKKSLFFVDFSIMAIKQHFVKCVFVRVLVKTCHGYIIVKLNPPVGGNKSLS